MLARHANRTFSIALMLSLALHAALILTMPNPLGASPVAAAPSSKPVKVRLTSPPPPPASQPNTPKEIDLGLDAPAPPSPTWLGYTEYVKQMMAKSAVEQAAFTDDPVAASPPPTPPSPQPQEQSPPSPPVERPADEAAQRPPTPESTDATKTVAPDDAANAPQPPPPTPHQAPNPVDDHTANPSEAPSESTAKKQPEPDSSNSPAAPEPKNDQTIEQTPSTSDEAVIALAHVDPQPDALLSEQPAAPESQEIEREPAEESKGETNSASSFVDAVTELAAEALDFAERAAVKKSLEDTSGPTEAQPQPTPHNPSPPVEPQPVIAREPRVGAPNDGAQSDRESDPSSIIDVPRDQWQLGKPLAAHGLEVKPRRPTMPVLTTLTAWPANPLCKVCFDSTGVPKRATLLRGTGDERVDSAIEASLYRWRAAGKPLETLRGEQTFDITIRLLINPARKNEDNGDQ